ncbi:MAG: hypothetical protein ACD_20C00241G0002 [uncultured bacterium]|nr:MAG: hypothetical protein ACD_20C00241G0002 [uncultured bacterium]
MEFFKKLQRNYRDDVLTVSILFVLFIFLALIFLTRQGHPIIDCFNGPFISSEILKGSILYKDIFIPHGPFPYQLNALLFIFFGEHLNTLYAAGIINSLITLGTIYLITRSISSRWVAFTITFITMTSSVFHYYIFNYIFPYVHTITYALTALLLSLLFIIYYLKYSKPVYATLSLSFISLSLLSKQDFFLFLVPLFVIIMYLKPLTIKNLIKSIIIASIIPIISWSTLFLQGLTIADLSNYLYHFKKFATSPLINYFYSQYTGIYPSIQYLILNIETAIRVFLIFSISLGFIYPLIDMIQNKLNNLHKLIKTLLIAPLIVLPLYICQKIMIDNVIFSWIGITTSLILIFTVFTLIFKKENLKDTTFTNKIRKIINTLKETDLNCKIFILIAITAIIASLKSHFSISIGSFGTFLIPLTLMVNVVFLVDHLPKHFKFLQPDIWKKACLLILIAMGLVIGMRHAYITKTNFSGIITTKKGSFHTAEFFAKPLNQTIQYINKELPPDATFIMMPQGPILNFLTDHRSHGWYYDLIPPAIIGFDENKIVRNLQNDPPDYIFINNRNSADWGFPYFAKDYAFKIRQFIIDNYEYKGQFGKEFNIKIFKRKDKN